MSELSAEVKLILQQIDDIDRQRVALWCRRERMVALLERLAGEDKSDADSMPDVCEQHADSNAELCRCNAKVNATQNDAHQ